MSNEQLQSDEVEALTAIYGAEWITEDAANRVYSITVKTEDGQDESKTNGITMQVRMPADYPMEAPPLYTLSAPWMSRHEKVRVMNELEELYCQNSGESIVYMWIEKLREHLNKSDSGSAKASSSSEDLSPEDMLNYDYVSSGSKHKHSVEDVEEIILHGEPTIDRRSVFQAHVAPVDCVEHAKQIIAVLKSNKKIDSATHNITAYRISGGPHNTCIQDCDDDGEAHAGARLLHLMQILDVRNVVVMVSRWYGGIQLGPDRFKHINNVARDLLEKGGFLELNGQDQASAGQKKNKKK